MSDHERDRTLQLLRALRDAPADDRARRAIDASLERFATDPEVVATAAVTLIRHAERAPADEPPLREGPAARAASVLRRGLESLDAEAKRDPDRAGYLWINLANALRLAGPAEDEAALEAFEQALRLAPERGAWWFDRGLFHKTRGQWEQALDSALRARSRLGPTKPVLWNMVIAATALGQGDLAAGSLKQLGIDASVAKGGHYPLVDALPPVQVRVPSRLGGDAGSSAAPATFEQVVVAPLSPCHGVVQSATRGDAPVDNGDLVLWDVAPVAAGAEGPVFPLLARLRQGREGRFPFVGMQQDAGDLSAIGAALPDGARFHLHAETTQWICSRCASGEALVKHAHTDPEEHRFISGKLLVTEDLALEAVRGALEDELRRNGRVALAVPDLYERLGDDKTAGQQREAWRGLERAAATSR
jgi:hypothetical protein